MNKILSFADLHLGIKTYSTQQSNGLFDAEVEARIALERVLDRASKDDIFAVVGAGDIFHNSHPSTENISFFIGWLKRMDKLGKPVFITTGNHDVSTHSHALVFMKKLKLQNIELFDSKDTLNTVLNFGEWTVAFAPFLSSKSSKDRTTATYDLISDIVDKYQGQKLILVTHIHEKESKVGSEAVMLSRQVDNIDFNEFDSDCVILTGHIHRHQIYIKSKGARVVYPGSLYYNDYSDINQPKGYVLIDKAGEINFEAITGIRQFVRYEIPDGVDAIEYSKGFRLGTNKVIFVRAPSTNRINDSQLRSFLKERGCTLGKVIYTSKETKNEEIIIESDQKMSPYEMFKHHMEKWMPTQQDIKYEADMVHKGLECIEEVTN